MLEGKISVMEKNKELEFKSFKLESDDFVRHSLMILWRYLCLQYPGGA